MKTMDKLSDAAIRNAKARESTRKMSDGGGLYVAVMPNGSKLWRMAYRFDGKQKLLSFGTYPQVSLKDARDHREEAKKLLANGADPGEVKKEQKAAQRATRYYTFEVVAREWIEVHRKKFPASAPRQWSNLERHVFASLGSMPVYKTCYPPARCRSRPLPPQGHVARNGRSAPRAPARRIGC